MAGVHANINAAPVDVEEKFADAMEARAAAPRRHEVFQEYIARVALPENAEVLGIGCDTGGITRQLAAIPGLGRGTGRDPAPVPLGRARQLASGIDGIHFVDDDCREIEAGDAGYDVARYKNIAAYTAIAVGAEVDPDSGAVRVVRAVAANDSGQIINPDRVRNQVEGGVVQSTSWTVKEAVLFDRTRILSEDWATYPIPRFPEVPEVEVELIDRPGEPYLGTGETAQGPTARAIANAVFGAAGARARSR